MAASYLRFGAHATREVGMDFANMMSQLPASERSQAKIGVFTDPNVAKLDVMKIVEESLMQEGLNFVLWDKVSVEPTDHSWQVSSASTEQVLKRMTGCDRLCEEFENHPLPSCWRWLVNGHCQSCQLVYELSRGGYLRVYQCTHWQGETD